MGIEVPDRRKGSEGMKKQGRWDAAGWILLAAAVVMGVWDYRGDSGLLQFICSAAPWVLMGLAILVLCLLPEKDHGDKG